MEWLKKLLGDDLYKQVTEKLGDTKVMQDDGKMVPKSRLDEVITQRDTYKGQIDETSKKITDLEKAAAGNTELLGQIDTLKADKEAAETKVSKIALESAIKLGAITAKAKDPSDILAFLDQSKLKLDGDKVLGLEDALKGLQETKAYLFGEAAAPDTTGAGGNPAGGGSNLPSATELEMIEVQKAMGTYVESAK